MPRAVTFGKTSARLGSSDGEYLKSLHGELTGARAITCLGNAESLGGEAFTHALALRRAKAACRVIAAGLPVTVYTVGLVDPPPTGAQDTPADRARNRRVTIIITN